MKAKKKKKKKKKKVRIGVIGVGMIGQDHIRRITQVLTGGSVTAVNDVDAARAGQARGGPARRVSPTLSASGPHRGRQRGRRAGRVRGTCRPGAGRRRDGGGKPVFWEKLLAPASDACQRIMDAEMAAGRRLVQGRLHAPL